MALIQCKECGKEISDQAMACPNCGCPSDAQAKFQKLQKINAESSRTGKVIIGILLAIVGFSIMFTGLRSIMG